MKTQEQILDKIKKLRFELKGAYKQEDFETYVRIDREIITLLWVLNE